MLATLRDGSRAGAFVAATWLIGLGLVFLAQQWIDLPWTDAWPLFVILVGVGSLASVFVSWRRPGPFMAALGWPLLLIAVGVLLLLSTTGSLGIGPGELIGRWWPVAIIIGGAWLLLAAFLPSGSATGDALELPLSGATSAAVRVRFGGGELTVRAAGTGHLVDGSFAGGVRHRTGGGGRVELEPEGWSGWPFFREWPRWDMGVSTEVPLVLEVEGGASRTTLDLSDTRLRSLTLKTGASETRVLLPRAAGETSVRAEAGAASLTFDVPQGVAASIHSRMAVGSTKVDERRFPRGGDGWESADYATASNKVRLDLSGGVGSIRVQ